MVRYYYFQAAREDRENIIKMLQEQEYLEKNSQDDIAERQKTERVKKETKEALTSQMENRRRLAEEEKKKEAEFRRQVCLYSYVKYDFIIFIKFKKKIIIKKFF